MEILIKNKNRSCDSFDIQDFLQGSKNEALSVIGFIPIINCDFTVNNVPNIGDVRTLISILKKVGFRIKFTKNKVKYLYTEPNNLYPPNAQVRKLMGKIRSSIYIWQVLAKYFDRFTVPLPGGCDLGDRGFKLILDLFEKIGWNVNILKNEITFLKIGRTGNHIKLKLESPTHIGSNIALGFGPFFKSLEIGGLSGQPEINARKQLLKEVGFDCKGKNNCFKIANNLKTVKDIIYDVNSDRIVTFAYILLVMQLNGICKIQTNEIGFLKQEIRYLKKVGVKIWSENNYTFFKLYNVSNGHLIFKTGVYPEFTTDNQPAFTSFLLINNVKFTFYEYMFSNRFDFITQIDNHSQLKAKKNNSLNKKFKASLSTKDFNIQKVYDKEAHYIAPDLRGGFALLFFGCSTSKKVKIDNSFQIKRGYEKLDRLLPKLGCYIA